MEFEKKMKAYALVLALALLSGTVGAQSRSSILNRSRGGASRNAASAPAAAAANALAEASAAADGVEGDTTSDLNFKEAPVEIVFQVYGKLVDRTVLKDPATPSVNITLESRPGQRLSKEEQIEAIEVVCEMNGIHFENYGEKFVRALPRKEASKEGIPLYMDPQVEELRAVPMGKVVSVMINFKNISAQEEAQKALEGFKTGNGLLQVFERTNSILVTDTKQNIVRMLEIARAIDIATPVLENVYVRQIKNASASDIKTALEQIVQESQKELEKNGKAQQNAAASAAARPMQPSFLRRPGQNGANQQPQPTTLDSLVTSVSDADRGLIRGKVLILADERSNKLVVITSKSNMDFFDRVIEQLDVETTPDTVVKVYRLKYADAEDVSDMINDLIGNSASGRNSGSSRGNQNQNAKAGSSSNLTRNTSGGSASRSPANQRSGEAKAGELSKDNTTVLADKRINGLVVMTEKELVPTIENIIQSMDVKLSQVLIETVIIEVTLGDELRTGIDWVQKGKNNTMLNRNNYMLGGGGGNYSSQLSQLMGQATTAATGSVTSALSPIGGGINYFLKSDRLNLAAIVEASKNDSHAKYIASPIVMTVDNKEATIEATEARKFFNGYETSSSTYNYIRTPKYDSKDIGITIKVTPKINPNGTVMLTVEEEYSQLGAGQSILVDDGGTAQIDTSLTRKMSADILLENSESVVLGGLTQTRTSESEGGVPFLKDIPWIGKWLFGTVTQTETRNELLVFMTPYVLDDAESAQAEALRRKKAMSDPSPWEDHGWSASKLADPITKKEQMRRLKEEAKRQDEERASRRAVEEWKLKRAKDLEKMDEEERNRFDEFMKEQRNLSELAEQMRTKRMAEAETKIEKAVEAEAEKKSPKPESSLAPAPEPSGANDGSAPSAPQPAPSGDGQAEPVQSAPAGQELKFMLEDLESESTVPLTPATVPAA
ncbi:MAG: hypothetical protein J6P13_01205 [Kiritimatiellae bacterium]|nr:hypothetical protein [Kiritimatiellia bacterium]